MAVPVMPDNVRSNAQMFDGITDDTINRYISEATQRATADKLPDAFINEGIIDFTRHKVYIDFAMQYGGVQSASTLGQSQTNLDLISKNDPYLSDYLDLVDRYGESSELGAVWAEDLGNIYDGFKASD